MEHTTTSHTLLIDKNTGEEIKPIPVAEVINRKQGIRRNDICDCGSGKKYKKCCYVRVRQSRIDLAEQQRQDTQAALEQFEVNQQLNPIMPTLLGILG